MIRTVRVIPFLSAITALSPVAVAQQLKSMEELVAEMREQEKAAHSVYLEMISKGSYPGNLEFETKGTLRVLQGTHFHMELEARFGGEIAARSEMVKTPEGIWMREDDPSFGEVFLKMDRDLAQKLDEASRILGQAGGGLPGPMAEQSTSPLGGSMIESLSQQYDLKVERKLVKDGQECWVVAGDLRGGLPAPAENAPPLPDRVDILVRIVDSAVVQMVHLKDGHEQLRVTITKLELNRPMDATEFQIDMQGREPVDVMDYQPTAQQIQAVLDAAEAKKKDG